MCVLWQECEVLCSRSELTDETALPPGEGHLQPPEPEEEASEDLEESNALPTFPLSPALPPAAPLDTLLTKPAWPRQEEKRTYAMEHFRWSKPVGRKRRPIKVFTNDVEEESSEVLPAEMRREAAEMRREAALDDAAAVAADYGVGVVAAEKQEQDTLAGLLQQKKDAAAVPYVIKHFRWSAPPAAKRYGGFMKSWDERSQKPLLTLFKNVINKDGQQKKDE